MKNRLLLPFQKFIHKINQYINNFSRRSNRWIILSFNGLLGLTCALLITFLGMAMDRASISPNSKTYIKIGLPYQTSWLGNSIGNGRLRVQNNIESMYVAADGTVYTNSHWDEAAAEAGIYKDGKPIAILEDTHGWNRIGGKAITVNSKYIFMAMIQGGMKSDKEDYPPEGKNWYCVRRYTLQGKAAPFKGGRGWDKSMLITSTETEVTGLANIGDKLFVSIGGANLVRVYNTTTMEEVSSFSVINPGAITVDRQGTLWIIQARRGFIPATVAHYSPKGTKLAEQILDVVDPSAIAIDHRGRLLVADNGPRQQVLIYDISKQPTQVGTFGTEKGIFGGLPGEVHSLKLYGITGIGTDATGNFYINNNGFNKSGTDLRMYSPSGQQLWQLLGLIFVDNADADPKTDAANVFTKHEQYLMDYNKPAGRQWVYKAYTLNPFKYPQDPRLHTSPDGTFFRRIQGKPYLFLTDMYNQFLQIYRFQPDTDGKIAIPAGMFVGTNAEGKESIQGNWPPHQPVKGEWIWRDRNGNGGFDKTEYDSSEDYPYIGGWWVDSKGDVWKTLRTQDGIGIRHYPLLGIDAKGNPIYSYKSMVKETTPSFITDIRRIEYFPETDTMYLSGFTKEHPPVGDDYGVVGSEIARFDNWSQGNRNATWRAVVPYDTTGQRQISTAAMSIAGDYLFTITVKTAEVSVFNLANGELVKKFSPGPEVDQESGWVDIPYGIRAFRRANGEYLLFAEENWKGKVLVYQLPI
ncbi:NHL repeat-containing protein [Richelia sinica FACHB-800]|uniref:NHL repeat-containing protein n=1 Tax=Richelia sinica FACHB-800 TaxID=1357546 RepID=A0A975T8U8_9NOST|nr:hypothetical protein [Richelia sinica]MBD2665768.1 hypothetical protein [Richelia sinica FACHB-800]QXE23582.1 NHL repeat-containing protein [Richelia sinica FACHB-800]